MNNRIVKIEIDLEGVWAGYGFLDKNGNSIEWSKLSFFEQRQVLNALREGYNMLSKFYLEV